MIKIRQFSDNFIQLHGFTQSKYFLDQSHDNLKETQSSELNGILNKD